AELERDPALARRVASALSGDASEPPAVSPAPAHPALRTDAEPEKRAQPAAAVKRTPRQFTPVIITGVSPALGPGIPDPFALARHLGPQAFREALAGLRRGTLRAIIREHGLASPARVASLNDDEKLRAIILGAVAAR
ncbi:MAG: hypothetical protein ACHQ4H_11535, partial [Ktedonobacterales bacterium]